MNDGQDCRAETRISMSQIIITIFDGALRQQLKMRLRFGFVEEFV